MRQLVLLFLGSPLIAQPVSVSLRAGVLATPLLAAKGPQQASASPFTIGPGIEVHLWRGVSFSGEFLLRHAELTASTAGLSPAKLWVWETPGTLIYRFQRPRRIFLRAGVSFNRVFDISGASQCARGPFGERFYCLDDGALFELRHTSATGFVLGGGLRLKWKKLRLAPELRLTHWTDRNVGVRDSAVRSNLNQVGFLLGVGR